MTWPKVPNLIVSSCPLVLSNSCPEGAVNDILRARSGRPNTLTSPALAIARLHQTHSKAANTAATTFVREIPIRRSSCRFLAPSQCQLDQKFGCIGASYGPKQVKRKLPTKGRGGCSETAARAHGRLGSWPCKNAT